MSEVKNNLSNEKKSLDNIVKREFYIKAQTIIKNAKINKYMKEGKKVSEEGMTFLGSITGKNTLQIERLKNVKLRIELLQTERFIEKNQYEIVDILADINSCAISEFSGNFTDEMNELYTELKEKYSEDNVTDDEIFKLSCEKISKGQAYLPMVHNEKTRGFFGEIRNQVAFYRIENKRLQDLIIKERGKIQLETFSDNLLTPIVKPV